MPLLKAHTKIRPSFGTGRSLADPDIEILLDKTQFFRTLYYLATASHSVYLRDQARDLWRMIAIFPQAGVYAGYAQRQLVSAWEEERLRHTVRSIPVQAMPLNQFVRNIATFIVAAGRNIYPECDQGTYTRKAEGS